MRQTVATAPSHSLVLVMDRSLAVIPETMAAGLVSATPTCLAVGTLSEHDGETSICLLDDGTPSGLGPAPQFDGVLKTPSRILSVCSVLQEVLLEMHVPSDETRVQVWANHPSEPDALAIVVVPSCTSTLLTLAQLGEIQARCDRASAGPWKSMIEGRDHTAGSSFIMTGPPEQRGPDIELSGATAADQDFIAHARQDVARLLEEVRRLRAALDEE